MRVLFLNHKIKECGVYQYGKRIFDILVKSQNITFLYEEVGSFDDYIQFLREQPNEKLDCILYNFHCSTMYWLTKDNIQKHLTNIAITHESQTDVFDFIIDIGNI